MQVINLQPIEKQTHVYDSLDVQAVFYTIQGEGPFAGLPAVFIRLAGCNLRCPACDTDYTSTRGMMDVEQLAATAEYTGEKSTKLVVITGGEPFRQWIGKLTDKLLEHFEFVQVETNGTLEPDMVFKQMRNQHPNRVHVVVSPKTGRIQDYFHKHASAFKYVMRANSVLSDGLPETALDHACAKFVARPVGRNSHEIYLQPLDEKNKTANKDNQEAVIESCLEHGYRLNLQLHKIVGLE